MKKFRYWDSTNEGFVYSGKMDKLSEFFKYFEIEKVRYNEFCELELFSGLFDKNGKEIYENDKLTGGYFCSFDDYYGGWYFGNGFDGFMNRDGYDAHENEIIGHKHTKKKVEDSKSLNLNENIKIKILPKGFEYMAEQHIKFYSGHNMPGAFPDLAEASYYSNKVGDDGYYEMQLWTFINTFGSVAHLGSSGYFELDIIIKNKDLKEID